MDGTNTIYFDNLFMWQVGGIATKINHDKSCRPTPIISRELSVTKINHDKSCSPNHDKSYSPTPIICRELSVTKINHDKNCSPTPIISRELSDSKRDKHIGPFGFELIVAEN